MRFGDSCRASLRAETSAVSSRLLHLCYAQRRITYNHMSTPAPSDAYGRLREQRVYMVPTRDHDEIRQWADRFGAVPAEIKPRKFDGQPSILYFLFGEAGQGTPELQPISWESFFAQFDLLRLAFAYDAETPRFNIVKVEKSAEANMWH